MIKYRQARPTGMLPVLERIRARLVPPTTFNHSEQAAATPYQLCQWCKKFGTELRPVLVKLRYCQQGSSAVVAHYPKLEELLGEAREGCHLCCMFLGSLCHPEYDMLIKKYPLEEYGESIHTQVIYAKHRDQDERYEIRLGQIGSKFLEYDPFVNALELTSSSANWESSRDAQISRYTGSEACYQMVREWIRTCTSQHHSCNVNRPKQRPTRLLDLEFDDTNDVKLVTGDSNATPYATLSYCWGSVNQLMLLSTNHTQFMHHIPFADLSHVAQDAVKVCRGLSIRYLWIDALCIIQGEDGDFAQEAPRMNDIYGGSAINITAAESSDTTQHFLCYREPLQYMDCELSTVQINGYQASLTNRHVCRAEGTRNRPGEYHIDSRAWFYQERFLSPRSVYFGSKGIHWECREGIACELQADIRIDDVHYKESTWALNDVAWNLKSKFAEVSALDSALTSPKAVGALREVWGAILESYVGMQLTRSTDRLVAMAGIASMFETTFGLRATFGLWIDFLIEELLWTVNPNSRHAQLHWQAPSWSWANLEDCSVVPSRALRPGEKFGRHTCLEVTSAPIIRKPSQAGFLNLPPIDTESGSLCLRGRLAPCRLQEHDNRYSLTPRQNISSLIVDADDHSEPRAFEPDAFFSFDADDADDVFCLLIRSELHFVSDIDRANHHVEYYGLVLPPVERVEGRFIVEGTERRFIRLGIYSESYENFKEGDSHYNPDRLVHPETKFLWKAAGEEQDVIIV